MNTTINANEFNKIIKNYLTNLESELVERWNLLSASVEQRELIEVIAGLLSRQVAITNYYLNSPNTWNGDIGTIILRTICENVINISWILKEDSLKRAKMFIAYGLGQEKLQLEHRKKDIQSREATEEELQMIELMDDSLNQERYSILTDVNIGSWSDKSVLKIAEESDNINFYHFVFTPFSNSSHGTWNHIMRYNLKISSNPMHNLLKRPIFYDFDPEINYAELAMKYMSKSFGKFDIYFKPDLSTKDSYEIYLSEIDNLIIDTND